MSLNSETRPNTNATFEATLISLPKIKLPPYPLQIASKIDTFWHNIGHNVGSMTRMKPGSTLGVQHCMRDLGLMHFRYIFPAIRQL
jgi:hypothetical protein